MQRGVNPAHQTADTIRLFAYGTLMYPDIWKAVVGRMVSSRKATIIGYRALCVAGHDFPGLVPADDSEAVDGLLYENITEAELQTLDDYESSMYDRVIVELQEDGVHAYVYLVIEERRGELTDQPWQPDRGRLPS